MVESNGTYTLRNAANNNLVLDASGTNPKSGANVSAWTSHGGNNQKWKLTKMNDLSAASVSSSGMVRNKTGQQLKASVSVKIGGKTLKEGTDYTVLYGGSTTPPTNAGSYTVSIKGMGSYTGSKTVGTMRIVGSPALSNSAQYRLTSVSNSRYVLDAANSTPKVGSNVSVWTSHGGNNQKWIIEETSGGYIIRNAANPNLVLDAAGSTPKVGSNVSVWTSHGGNNQKWKIASI